MLGHLPGRAGVLAYGWLTMDFSPLCGLLKLFPYEFVAKILGIASVLV